MPNRKNAVRCIIPLLLKNRLPMWADKSAFYHIYPLGFCGAPARNDYNSAPIFRLQKILDWLPHFQELNINALYLGPVFQSFAHGYDTSDYFWLDNRLGTNEDFRHLVKVLHQNQIKVVLDGVFNHVGRGFWAFDDVRRHKADSRYVSWFKLDFSHNNRYDDGFCYEGWDGCDDLVKLNLSNPEVRQHLLSAVAMWIDEFAIDGLRLDVAHYLNSGFVRELRQMCRARKADFWLMGEMVFGDYRRLVNPQMLDSCTNYELYKALYSSCNDNNMYELAHTLQRQFAIGSGVYEGLNLYSFLDNHDVSRIASVIKDERQLKSLYGLLYTLPGIPSIYYGGEWGARGRREQSDAEVRPDYAAWENNDLSRHIAWWAKFRRESEVLAHGIYQELAISGQFLAFRRELAGQRLDIAVNIGAEPQNFKHGGIERVIAPYDICIL